MQRHAAVEAAHVVRCRAGAVQPLGPHKVAYAAVVRRRLAVYAAPGGRVVARFTRNNQNGVPTVFSVLGRRVDTRCRATWYHVELPIRPNGAAGWVRVQAVDVARVRTRIFVDVSQRRLRLYDNGRLVLTSPIAVGAPGTPTPVGRYYVNQRLIPTDPSGPYGPGAVGVSAFSNVLTGWAQGGPIGIHGTNEPWSIGHNVSNGCIRLPNSVIRRVFRIALAGTPVIISP